MEAGLKDATFTIVKVQASGDTAYEIGKMSLTVPSKDQGSKVVSGKYVVVWKRQANGPWKLHVDIWNTTPAQ
jgi:ketosteroid isomerase-like protein